MRSDVPEKILKAENRYIQNEKVFFQKKWQMSSAKKFWSIWHSNRYGHRNQPHVTSVNNHRPKCYLMWTRFSTLSYCASCERYKKMRGKTVISWRLVTFNIDRSQPSICLIILNCFLFKNETTMPQSKK